MLLTEKELTWLKKLVGWIEANYKNQQLTHDTNGDMIRNEKLIFGEDSGFREALHQYSKTAEDWDDEEEEKEKEEEKERALDALKNRFSSSLLLLSQMDHYLTSEEEKAAYHNFLENVCAALRRVDERYPSETNLKNELDRIQKKLADEKALADPEGRTGLIEEKIDQAIQNFKKLRLVLIDKEVNKDTDKDAVQQIIERFQELKTTASGFKSQLKEAGGEAKLGEIMDQQIQKFLAEIPDFYKVKGAVPGYAGAVKREQTTIRNTIKSLQTDITRILSEQDKPAVEKKVIPMLPLPAEPEVSADSDSKVSEKESGREAWKVMLNQAVKESEDAVKKQQAENAKMEAELEKARKESGLMEASSEDEEISRHKNVNPEEEDLMVMDTAFSNASEKLDDYLSKWKTLSHEDSVQIRQGFWDTWLWVTKYRRGDELSHKGGEKGLLYRLYKGLYDLEKMGYTMFYQNGPMKLQDKESFAFCDFLEGIRKELYKMSDRLNQPVGRDLYGEHGMVPFDKILSPEFDPILVPDDEKAFAQMQNNDEKQPDQQVEGFLYYIKKAKTAEEKLKALYSFRDHCESVGLSGFWKKAFYTEMAKSPKLTRLVVENGHKALRRINKFKDENGLEKPVQPMKTEQLKAIQKACDQSIEDIIIGRRFLNEMENKMIQVKGMYDKSVRDMLKPHPAFAEGATENDILLYAFQLERTVKEQENKIKNELEDEERPQQTLAAYIKHAYGHLNTRALANKDNKISPELNHILNLGCDKTLKLSINEMRVLSGTGSTEYTNLHQAYANYLTCRHTPGYDCTSEIKDVYVAAKNYLFKNDTAPFHDEGKKRVAVAARLMAQAGVHMLIRSDHAVRERMVESMEVEMLRSPVFRNEVINELNLIKMKTLNLTPNDFKGNEAMKEINQKKMDQTELKVKEEAELFHFAAEVNQRAERCSGGILKSGKISSEEIYNEHKALVNKIFTDELEAQKVDEDESYGPGGILL